MKLRFTAPSIKKGNWRDCTSALAEAFTIDKRIALGGGGDGIADGWIEWVGIKSSGYITQRHSSHH